MMNKKWISRIISAALAVALGVSLMPQDVVRAETISNYDSSIVSGFDWDNFTAVFAHDSGNVLSKAGNTYSDSSINTLAYSVGADAIPASYRNTNSITEVKNQNPWNACWAFAAIAAVETDLIENEGVSFASSLSDLSELQLFHFANNPVQDPLKQMLSGEYSGNSPLYDNKGNYYQSISAMACWMVSGTEQQAGSLSSYSTGSIISISKTYQKSFYLNNAYVIPTENRNVIKQMIMKYGSVTMSFNCSSVFGETSIYSTATIPDHMVQVIGWDDNYSSSNFSPYVPSGNGAWIIKNSYGNEYGDQGFCYISYENPSTYSDKCVVYDAEVGALADNNYQYDFISGEGHIRYNSGGNSYQSANVFTTKANKNGGERLKKISFYNDYQNATYTVKIYKSLTNSKNPTSGTLAKTITNVSCPYEGYYTVDVGNIPLSEGEKYSVVLSCSQGTTSIEINSRVESISLSGQSFLCANGVWYDLKSGDNYQDIRDNEGNYNRYYIGNFMIKAFTDNDNTIINASKISLNYTSKTLRGLDTLQLEASLYPNKVTDTSVNWSSSNTNVATVSKTGKVTAWNAGTATITATTCNGKKATCKITVKHYLDVMAKQTKASSTSVTFSWTPISSAAIKKIKDSKGVNPNGYVILAPASKSGSYYVVKYVSGISTKSTNVTTHITTSGKKIKLSYGMAKYYYVSPAYKSSSGKISFYHAGTRLTAVTRPAKVTGVKKSSVSKTAIKVKWTKVSGATGYYVYASTSKNGTYKKVGTVKAGTTYFTYKGLSKNKTYYFKIYAYKSNGSKAFLGSASSVVAIKTAK